MAVMHERIKELRNQKGLTLSQVANYLGVTEATAQRYETGKGIKTIPYRAIEKYANLFNCSPQYIMGWNEEDISIAEQNHEESMEDLHSLDIDAAESKLLKIFDEELGNIVFTEDEIRQLVAYAKLLIAARK